MITREALKRAMRASNVKWTGALGRSEEVIRFFEDVIDGIDQVHIEGPKPWTQDAMITYSAWQWDTIRTEVEQLPVVKVFVLVGLAEIWDYPEPYGYAGMGDEPVDPTDIPGTLRLRLAWAAEKVALKLFHSGGLKDLEDRR